MEVCTCLRYSLLLNSHLMARIDTNLERLKA